MGHLDGQALASFRNPMHPMNSELLESEDSPFVVAAANGDVDNFADLKRLRNLQIPKLITSDSKVIPACCQMNFPVNMGPLLTLMKLSGKQCKP